MLEGMPRLHEKKVIGHLHVRDLSILGVWYPEPNLLREGGIAEPHMVSCCPASPCLSFPSTSPFLDTGPSGTSAFNLDPLVLMLLPAF